MLFEIEPTITKKYLLEQRSQETYLEHYLGITIKKGLVKSPLRKDNTPTCSFYKNKSGDIIFKDFSGSFSGNFIGVVMYRYNCSYSKALKIIALDFGYISNKSLCNEIKPIQDSTTHFEETKETSIQVEIRNFTDFELKWWLQYGIDINTLKKYNVYSCNSVFLNGEYLHGNTNRGLIFGYYGGKNNDIELWRIYYPLRRNYRFLSNWKKCHIQGISQIPKNGKLLVITKSMKDVMCLHSLGINAIAPCSETLFLSNLQFDKLKQRFNTILLFYDNDLPGINSMNNIRKKYDIKCIWLPKDLKSKDISDFYKKYGREKTIELIDDACQKLEIDNQ